MYVQFSPRGFKQICLNSNITFPCLNAETNNKRIELTPEAVDEFLEVLYCSSLIL